MDKVIVAEKPRNGMAIELRKRALKQFLRRYGETGQFIRSAKKSGLSPQAVKRLMERDLNFAAKVDHAREEYLEILESKVDERAFHKGYKEPVYYEGDLVGHKPPKYSDAMAQLRLKKLDKKGYADHSKVEVDQTNRTVTYLPENGR